MDCNALSDALPFDAVNFIMLDFFPLPALLGGVLEPRGLVEVIRLDPPLALSELAMAKLSAFS